MPDEPQDPQPPPGVGDLQFTRAQYEGGPPALQCMACQAEMPDRYFQLGGAPVCAECASNWESQQKAAPAGWVMRGAMFGLAAAIAGAIGMSVVAAVTGYQFSLAAIGVGWLVGKAMRRGANGLGGRRVQILAVLLTYFGITLSYLPEMIKGFREVDKKRTEARKDEAPNPPEKPPGAAGTIVALTVLVAFCMAAPLLEIASGLNGILGLLILFFGLSQAWRMTARDERALSGPYSTKPEPEPAGP